MLKLCACILWFAVAVQTASVDVADWYVITLNNVSVGWMRTHTTPIKNGFRTESQTRLRMAREQKILSMSTSAWIEEDSEGHALRGGQTQSGGGLSVRLAWECADDGVHERRTQGATMKERLLPAIAKGTLAPAATKRAVQAAIAMGKTEFSFLILDAAQGLVPMQNNWQKLNATTLAIKGSPVECNGSTDSKWK